jgi:hypothetical protein
VKGPLRLVIDTAGVEELTMRNNVVALDDGQ